MISHVHLQNLGSHSLVPRERYDIDFPDYWEWIINIEMQAIEEFFALSMANLCNKVPTYIIRYEDVVADPLPVLRDLFSFILDTPDITGTILE